MRVLWIGHFVPWPPQGGAPQRSFHLLRELGRHAEVHFCGLSQRAHQPRRQDRERAAEALSAICRTVSIVPVPLRSSPPGKLWSLVRSFWNGRAYAETWLDDAAFRMEVRQAIARTRPDVLHVDSVLVAGALPDPCPVPAVLNHHNIESHMMRRRSRRGALAGRVVLAREATLRARLERREAARFAAHLVVSDLDGERLLRVIPGARWRVVANGVDTDAWTMRPEPELPHTVVFSGRMNWYPNEEAFVAFAERVWPEIRRHAPEAELVVAGMHPTRRVRAVARAAGGVHVTGAVPDMRPVLGRAAVVVCPILDGGGTRLKVLDAMALGRAIVATPLAVEGLGLEDGREALVRPLGPDFADAVLGLLVNPHLRMSLGLAARRRAELSFDWRSIGLRHAAALSAAAGADRSAVA